jgi:hypothetical protein
MLKPKTPAVLFALVTLGISPWFLGTARAAEVDPLLPADTYLVLSADLQQLMGTSLFHKYCCPCLEAALQEMGKTEGLRCLGLDTLPDIERITIAQHGDAKENNTLIVLNGHFDAAQFRDACKKYVRAGHGEVEEITDQGYCYCVFSDTSPRQHGSVTMGTPQDPKSGKALAIKWQGGMPSSPCDLLGTLFVAVVDENTVVVSTTPQDVLAAFAVSENSEPALRDDMRSLIARIHGKPTVWVAALANPCADDDAAADDAEDAEADPKIASLRASVRVSAGLDIRVTLAADSTADARQLLESVEDMATRVDGCVRMLDGNKKSPLSSLLTAFRTIRSGRRVKIEGHVDAALLADLLGMVAWEREPATEK